MNSLNLRRFINRVFKDLKIPLNRTAFHTCGDDGDILIYVPVGMQWLKFLWDPYKFVFVKGPLNTLFSRKGRVDQRKAPSNLVVSVRIKTKSIEIKNISKLLLFVFVEHPLDFLDCVSSIYITNSKS